MVFVRGKRKSIDAWKDNESFSLMTGKTVIAETGRMFHYDKQEYILVRLEHVVGITDSQDVSTIDSGEVKRCQKCKSKGEGNILTDTDGYCLQCGMNDEGQHRSQKQITVSRDEIERFGKEPQ